MTDDSEVPTSEVHVRALPVDMDYVTEELKIRAQKELFEEDDTVAQSLKLLRTMLKEETDLLWQDDDIFLLAFLRNRKFDVKKALAHVKGFYNTFGKHGDLYYGMDFEQLRSHMDTNSVNFLPYRDRDGAVVIVCRFNGWDPTVTSTQEMLVYFTFGFLQALLSPATQIAGFQFIQDFKDFSFKHLLSVNPSSIKFFIEIIQKTIPARLCGFHSVNENHMFSYLWPVIKPFLPRKVRERIHFHGSNLKTLHEFFAPSILPADLGGELPPFDNTEWRQRMETSADYIEKIRSFGYKKYLKKNWKKKKSNREK